MLSITEPCGCEGVTDALAGVVAVLHPNAGLGPAGMVVMSARGALLRFLRRARGHFQEHDLLLAALREAEPEACEILRPVAGDHRELRGLARRLCQKVREGRIEEGHRTARMLLALLLGHVAHERVLFLEALRSLDPAATHRFTEDLLGRLLRGREESVSLTAGGSLADLHGLYVRLIRLLQERPGAFRPAEVNHEHPCRR